MTGPQTSRCWHCDTPDDDGNPEYHYCEECRREWQRRAWRRFADALIRPERLH